MAPKKNSHSFKPTNKKMTGGTNRHQINKLLGDEIVEITEDYLSGNRSEAITKLSLVLNQSNMNKLRPFLKKSIYAYVKHFKKDFEGSIEIKNCVYQMFDDFEMTDFVERAWQYKPYYINANDYSKLQTAIKKPIHITNYDYLQPIYKLTNSINYDPKNLKLHKKALETIKNDVKFYISNEEDIAFAKVINLKYKPVNLQVAKKHNKNKTEEEKAFAVYDNYLYNRSLSISMYVLLDGDPNKAMPYFRYDNDPVPHKNIFIGDDKRKDVYGEIALNPHFHFQNEDDSLLCLRKFKTEDGKTKYNTGRCNAIDCGHLKKYLLELDVMTPNELDRQKLDFNMPFLDLKRKNQKVGVNVDNLFYNFLKDRTDEEICFLEDIELWLSHSKNAKVYNNGKCFDKMIRTLDFLHRLSSLMDDCLNYEQRKLYSQLEIYVSDALVNSISNIQKKCLAQGQEPKYTIETDLYEHCKN